MIAIVTRLAVTYSCWRCRQITADCQLECIWCYCRGCERYYCSYGTISVMSMSVFFFFSNLQIFSTIFFFMAMHRIADKKKKHILVGLEGKVRGSSESLCRKICANQSCSCWDIWIYKVDADLLEGRVRGSAVQLGFSFGPLISLPSFMAIHLIVIKFSTSWKHEKKKSGDDQSQCDRSSGEHECLSKMSLESIE